MWRELLSTLISSSDTAGKEIHLAKPLASMIASRRDQTEILSVLTTLVEQSKVKQQPSHIQSLAGLVEGLKRGKAIEKPHPKIVKSLNQLLTSTTGELQNLSFQTARAMNIQQTPAMKNLFQSAMKTSLDDGTKLPQRLSAVRLLANASFSLNAEPLEKLLEPRQPIELQQAAVSALAEGSDSKVATVLLTYWTSYTPKMRNKVITAIFSRSNRLSILLDAIEQKKVKLQDFTAFQRVQLTENSDANIRKRAKFLFAKLETKLDGKLLKRYTQALKTPGDAKQGEAIFTKNCSKCHKLNGKGFEVGPDLAAARARADETILLDVLRPSSQITTGYRSYIIQTENGLIVSGILAAETTNSITLKKEEGKKQTVLRTNIDEMNAAPVSLMPEGMEKLITPKEMTHLIAFLRKSLGSATPSVVTLFDE